MRSERGVREAMRSERGGEGVRSVPGRKRIEWRPVVAVSGGTKNAESADVVPTD